MKKLLSFMFSFLVLISLVTPVCAADYSSVMFSEETVSADGLTIVKEVFDVSNARSTNKTYTYRITIMDGDIVIGIIAITATFQYDGSSVSVISKAVTQADTYDGWGYMQNSFSSSGGTVTLNARLTKWIILNTSFTMTLSCDKDGNISYT